MIIFAHRGKGFDKKENSMDAFKKVLEEGFSLEIDVRRTNDNEVVINHDPSLGREHKKLISEYSLSEIKNYFHLISLEELFKYYQEKKNSFQLIAIHLKDECQIPLLNLVAKKIFEYGLEKNCFLFDLTLDNLDYFRKKFPKLKIGISLGEKNYSRTIYTLNDLKKGIFVDVIWLDEWEGGLLSKNTISKIKNFCKIIYVVSPELHVGQNHPSSRDLNAIKKLWWSLLGWGVSGVCTDYPRKLRELTEKY